LGAAALRDPSRLAWAAPQASVVWVAPPEWCCAGTLMTVGYGVCTPLMYMPPGSVLAGQFKGDGTSPPVNFVPDANNTLGGWVASELFPALAGTPTPGVCAAPQAIPSGGYTATGPQTLCCL
jgi:hypothetical protein